MKLQHLAACWLFLAVHVAAQAQGLKKISIKNAHASVIGFSPNGAHFIATRENVVQLYNAGTDTKISEFEGPNHADAINAIAFSQDGNLLATAGEDKQVKIWSLPDGKIPFAYDRFSLPVKNVAFINDDQLLICILQDGSAHAIDYREGKIIYIRNDFKGSATLSASHNGKYWAAGGAEPYVIMYDAATGAVVKKRRG